VLSEGKPKWRPRLEYQDIWQPLASICRSPCLVTKISSERTRARWRTREWSGEDSYEGQAFAMSAGSSQKVGEPLLAVPL
jgi:hypothetical protein